MISGLLAIFGGIAAHQTDRVFVELQASGTPRGWINMSRSGVGTLTIIAAIGLIAPKAVRSIIMLYTLAAAVLVGIGVAIGYWLDFLSDKENNHYGSKKRKGKPLQSETATDLN
jgi:hypothetical protein